MRQQSSSEGGWGHGTGANGECKSDGKLGLGDTHMEQRKRGNYLIEIGSSVTRGGIGEEGRGIYRNVDGTETTGRNH